MSATMSTLNAVAVWRRNESNSFTSSSSSSSRRGARIQRSSRSRRQNAGCSSSSSSPSGQTTSFNQQILRDVTKKLRDCVKRKAPSSAVDLLVSLGRDHGIEPDARAASTCIAACIAGRDLDMAEKVFEQVFEGGVCEPDEIAVAELVKGYLTIGRENVPLWQKATSLCAKMTNEYGITRTAVTYNVLLQCCANTNDFERAEEIIDTMYDEEVAPSPETFKAVEKRRSIRSYAKKVLM
jgi:pentatricopeptide repeat protein